MSVEEAVVRNAGNTRKEKVHAKSCYVDECFSSVETIKIGNGPLENLDSEKLKMEIKKWAKAVVSYARQVSGHFDGSSG
ncbi:hypothetical protein IFM89_028128 [Coptis chinensis]|uniref:Uncharacterized protein n=1 Tax=Coptis chinensis TaxID=261450 RepID=A0A835HYJ0_9MAGN|nr:hypothetical protein IFM89_028128 [Coptis chinensis]